MKILEAFGEHPVLVVGVMTFAGLYAGKFVKVLKLPSIIGFMFLGVLLGPSFAAVLDHELFTKMSFVSDIALGFVALSIGLELQVSSLKHLGKGIVAIIFAESLAAFVLVFTGVYLFTGNLPMALIFGAIAPASAPAGTVAVIREYNAKGPLTKALFAVVGFDDGLGIIIFGFASAASKSILSGGAEKGWMLLAVPLFEIVLSLFTGFILARIFIYTATRIKHPSELLILIFCTVLIGCGVSSLLGLSLILTNMMLGLTVANSSKASLIQRISGELMRVMPLLFIMFFILAGANLHVNALPSLGMLGIIYMAARSGGLLGGAWLGAVLSRSSQVIRKYLGLGILSQAGVAIGLALSVKKDFTGFGAEGAYIGATVITTVTATCIVFELIGPVLTKKALEKAGEI